MAKKLKAIALLLLAGAAFFFIGSRVYDIKQAQSQSEGRPRGEGRMVTVSVVEASTGVIREELLLTGALKPKEQVDVTPKATGRLEKIYFQIGDRVRAGDLIAELEDDEIRQQVNRASAAIEVSRAARAQREAERRNAEAELERAATLIEDGLVSRQDYEARKTTLAVVSAQLDLAEAQIQQAEAELRELKIRLEQTRIYAPMSGIVAQRYVDPGALVSPSTPLLRIVNLTTLVTQANVPEVNIGSLRVGNETVVRVDAVPDAVFRGRVSRIAPVLDAATRTALVEIDVPNPEGLLKAEMFARIQLDSGRTREAILIPREALVYRGQQPGVYLVEGNEPVFRTIETGLTRGEEVEVLANLEPGTRIVGRGATMLTKGDRIRVARPGEEEGAVRARSEADANPSPTTGAAGAVPAAGSVAR